MKKYYLNYLDELESEAIFILREVWAQFQNPVLLFSGGKDSILVAHLAQKAFYPSKIPFSFLHVDTGHNFPETIHFRDQLMNHMKHRDWYPTDRTIDVMIATFCIENQIELLHTDRDFDPIQEHLGLKTIELSKYS